MPPEQCPECARFLKSDLVASLERSDRVCPGCESVLTAAMFPHVHGTGGGDATTANAQGAATGKTSGKEKATEKAPAKQTAAKQAPARKTAAKKAHATPSPAEVDATIPTATPAPSVSGSVRPPDLATRQVRDRDPLAGWDDSPLPPAAGEDRTIALAAAGGAALGALTGLAIARQRKASGMVLGAALGAAAAAAGAKAVSER